MTTIANLVAHLGLDAADYDKGVKQVTKSASGLGAAISSAVSMAGGFVMANVAMSAFGKVTEAVSGGIIGMNASLQKSTLQFETLMGSADQAREHVEMLFDFARATPFETQPIIDASRMLQTFGGAALNTRENLTRIGDAAAATNTGIQELGFWVGRAYSAIAAGRPFGEAAMRLQELAVLSPKARSEMERLQASGASAAEVWRVMEQDLDRFKGAMERQAGTWEGLTSTFSDTLGILSSTAFRPFFEMASGGLKRINDLLGTDEVKRWAERVAGAIRVALQAFGTLASGVGSTLGSVLRIVQTVGQAIYQALQWINPFARHSPSIVEQVQAGIEAIAGAYGRLGPAIGSGLASAEAAVRAFEDAVAGGAARVMEHTRAETEKLLAAMGPGAIAAWQAASDQVAQLEADLEALGSELENAARALEGAQEGLAVLEEAARKSKEEVSDLEDQLNAAERSLRFFTGAELAGTEQFADALWENEQAARKLQLQLAELRLAGKGLTDKWAIDANRRAIEEIENQLDAVRIAGEKIRLEEELSLGPQRRELEKIGKLGKELTFEEAKAGALAARAEIERIRPALAAARQQQAAAEEAARRQRDLVDQQKASLEDLRDRYDRVKDSVSGYQKAIEDVLATARELDSISRAASAGGAGAAGADMAMETPLAEAMSPIKDLQETVSEAQKVVEGFQGALSTLDSKVFEVQKTIGGFARAFELLFDPETRQIGLDYFGGLFDRIGKTVSDAVPRILGKVQEIRIGILDWIVEMAPVLIQRLADWAGAFVGWIGPIIPEAIKGLGSYYETMIEWVLANAPRLAATLGEWGTKLVDWIILALPVLLENAEVLLSGLLTWVYDNAPRLIDTVLGEWLPAVLDWVLDAAEKIIPNLLVFLGSIMDWLTENGPVLAFHFLSEWAPAAIAWVAKAAVDIVPRLFGLLGTITGWIVTEAVPKLFTFAIKMGGAILGGIGEGLKNLGAKLIEWIQNAIASIHIDFGWIVIDGRNGVSFNIPSPPVPEIPHFAEGAIATSPTLGVFGDVAGGEAVIPLRDLPALVPALAASGESGVQPATGDTFVFHVDAREAAVTERELYYHAERARMLRDMGRAR